MLEGIAIQGKTVQEDAIKPASYWQIGWIGLNCLISRTEGLPTKCCMGM